MEERDLSSLQGLRVAFAFTASYCTLEKALAAMVELKQLGCTIIPVISYNVRDLDSRFGTTEYWRQSIIEGSGSSILIDTIAGAEPIGPKQLADIVVIAPASGNTIAKLAHGITDTPVLMAAKSQLRIGRPVLAAISTNDALAANAKNIGQLLNTRNIYFVPFGQDDPYKKPTSLSANLSLLPHAVCEACEGRQIQPLLV